jgi:hypothetical protein
VRIKAFAKKLTNKGLFRKKVESITPPVLSGATRFPYGPFRFLAKVTAGASYSVLSSSDLAHWKMISAGIASAQEVEYIDSDAANFGHRFYRVLVGDCPSANLIGYASVPLPPGFSLISNPFNPSESTIGTSFTGWPEGTTIHRYDSRMLRLNENAFKNGKWTNPNEKLLRGEGAIFFNPTQEYKVHSFVGEVALGTLTQPIPPGFSLRGSLVPRPGNLADDLGFPIAEGDVVHTFDRDRQKYTLHPFKDGRWISGAPVLGVGEAFWVAKTEPANWTKAMVLDG